MSFVYHYLSNTSSPNNACKNFAEWFLRRTNRVETIIPHDNVFLAWDKKACNQHSIPESLDSQIILIRCILVRSVYSQGQSYLKTSTFVQIYKFKPLHSYVCKKTSQHLFMLFSFWSGSLMCFDEFLLGSFIIALQFL